MSELKSLRLWLENNKWETQDHLDKHWMPQITSFFLHIGSFLKSIDVWKCVGVWLLKHAHSSYGFLASALLHVLVIRRSMWRPCFWPYGCVLTAVCLGHVDLAGRERYGILHMQKMIWDDVPMEELISKVRPKLRLTGLWELYFGGSGHSLNLL